MLQCAEWALPYPDDWFLPHIDWRCTGKLAGLETVRLIREPVAAALAYGLDLTEEQVRNSKEHILDAA